MLGAGVLFNLLPVPALIAFVMAPVAWRAFHIALRNAEDVERLIPAMGLNVLASNPYCFFIFRHRLWHMFFQLGDTGIVKRMRAQEFRGFPFRLGTEAFPEINGFARVVSGPRHV